MSRPLDHFHVQEADDAESWNRVLVQSPDANPLQSWEWGSAKLETGSRVLRLRVVDSQGKCAMQAQIFLKPIRFTPAYVGWIPKGPVWPPGFGHDGRAGILQAFRAECRKRGIYLLVSQPYRQSHSGHFGFSVPFQKREQTFCLDLQKDIGEMERALHHGWRNHKKRFIKNGGSIVENTSDSGVEPLINMYASLAERKGFDQYGGAELIRAVWRHLSRRPEVCVYAQVFQAVAKDQVCASIMVLRAGVTALYLWGAFDYEFRSIYPTEALQWHAIKVLKEDGVSTYDLGGADEQNRSGVFEFKRRMGAALITLPPSQAMVTV